MSKEFDKNLLLEKMSASTVLLVCYDVVAIIVSFFAALWIRFDCSYRAIPAYWFEPYRKSILVYTGFCILVFALTKLYSSIWKYASYFEILHCIIASLITTAGYILGLYVLQWRMPVSFFLFGEVIQFVLIVFIRFLYRFCLVIHGKYSNEHATAKKVIIVGAGSAGRAVARDLKRSRDLNEEVVCFIDDDNKKIGRYIDGILVKGDRYSIVDVCQRYDIDKIYSAVQNIAPKDKREILDICGSTSSEIMNLPEMSQIYSGDLTVSKMKPVVVEDLLGRKPIQVDMKEVFDYIEGKIVLVTGGGGSIGSELCRQIAAHSPKQLIIFDIYENNAYDIQLELKRKYPELDIKAIIGSVRDSRKVFKLFEEYRPEIVYHAAAHKHVPLMEDSPCESIKNNALGTYKTAYAAMIHGCRRFVLISTDKAVNPTNIMGASKRLCEMIIQSFDKKIKEGKAKEIPQFFTHSVKKKMIGHHLDEALEAAKTEFVAVRFGNVLGSNGSVIPLFKKQIEAGGPITVTHPDIIRYFMTIPEAVKLVMLAGTYANGGEIFVLDMGEPVKIVTLARNMIRLSGLKPDVDIEIVYTGLRPGEKLYEEKLMAEEGLKKTKNDLIHIGCPIPFDVDSFFVELGELMDAAYSNKDNIRDYVKKIVITYKPL